MSLLDEESLISPAVNYLAQKAHPSIRSHYANLLAGGDHGDIAKQIASEKMTAEKAQIKIFAVDDSSMILNIYRTVLHNLGYESELFEFPAEALERVQKEKPAAILTDLNMPEITGIDLTQRVRQWYNKDALPIIMVTTQDEAVDNKAAYAAGVNGILKKPFSQGQIGKALKEYAVMKVSQ